jgi:hypothetical protein
MAAAGEQYEPLDLAGAGGAAPTPIGLEMDEAEFRRAYGYGYTASYDTRLTVPPPADLEAAAAEPDRSAGEQAAYDDAFEACWHEAVALLPDPNDIPAAVAGRLESALASDPAVAAGQDGWAACVAARGFRYASRDEILADLEARMAPIYREANRLGVVVGQATPALSASASRALATVRAYELRVAAADADCSAPIEAAVEQVEAATTTEWLAARGDIEAFAAEASEVVQAAA